MEIVYREAYCPPVTIEGLPNIISRVELTAAENKQIATARSVIATVAQIGANTCGPASWNGYKCALQDAERTAWQALSESPSLEAAELYHAAAVRLAQAEQTAEGIGAALEIPRARATSSMLEICNAVLDRAKGILDSEADRHRGAIADTVQDQVFGLGTAFEDRVKHVTIAVDVERSRAKREPSQWLAEHGFLDQATARKTA